MSAELSREQLLQKAIECFRKAGLPAKIAECYEEWPKYLEAARIYENECNDPAGAARCLANAREYKRAAELWVRAKNYEEAVKNLRKAGDFLRAGSLLERELRDPKRAVEAYEQGACWLEAARVYDRTLSRPERALELYTKCLEKLPAGPSVDRARALFGAAWIRHSRGEEGPRQDLSEQGERVAEQLAEAGRSVEGARAFEALGDFGVRAGRSHQADTGFESALRLYRKANDAEGAKRVVARYLEYAKSVGNVSLAERLERER